MNADVTKLGDVSVPFNESYDLIDGSTHAQCWAYYSTNKGKWQYLNFNTLDFGTKVGGTWNHNGQWLIGGEGICKNTNNCRLWK